jgi:hypothetical protein
MVNASMSDDRNARFDGWDHRAKTTPFGTYGSFSESD